MLRRALPQAHNAPSYLLLATIVAVAVAESGKESPAFHQAQHEVVIVFQCLE